MVEASGRVALGQNLEQWEWLRRREAAERQTPEAAPPAAEQDPRPAADPLASRSVEPSAAADQAENQARQGAGGQGGQAVASSAEELSTDEERQVRELKVRDRKVRAHEQAHVAAGGGQVCGGASYSYQVGPDGRRYAVGGEVSIAAGQSGDPAATAREAQTVRRAALAPADPSAQDRAVAARAGQTERTARAELREEEVAAAEEDGSAAAALSPAGEPEADQAAGESSSAEPFPRPDGSGPPPFAARQRAVSLLA